MNPTEPKNETTTPEPKREPKLACTVLVSKTRIGDSLHGIGSPVKISKADADLLAGMNPPRVRIEGVA